MENGFYIDNIFIPNINHFPQMGSTGGNVSWLNMDFVERMDVSTGGFDAAYGNRLSSIIDIGYREGNRERINSQINFGIINYGAQIEGPLPGKRGSFMISAHRSFLTAIKDLVNDSGFHLSMISRGNSPTTLMTGIFFPFLQCTVTARPRRMRPAIPLTSASRNTRRPRLD